MKNKKVLMGTVFGLSMMYLLTACGGNSNDKTSNDDKEAKIHVVDMTGRDVYLEEAAQKVVVLDASDCEIIYALGKQDCIVGRGEYCDYPEEAKELDMVSSGSDLNAEQILALQPDLLIMSNMGQTPEQVETLEGAGIAVVTTDAQDIDGVYEDIKLVGTLVGADEEADHLCDEMKSQFDGIMEEAKNGKGGSVYFEVSPLEYGLWAAGNHTFMNEAAEMVGLTNIFADVDGWAEVSEEQVIERNPDHIVTITMYSGQGDTPEQEIMKRAGWESINAVKNSSILNLPNNELSRPGPRVAEGTQMLSDFVNGTQK